MSIGTVKIELGKHSDYALFLVFLAKTADETGAQVYIVGGAVRDTIMGKTASDFDIVPFGCDYTVFAGRLAKNMKGISVAFKDNVRIVKNGNETDVSKPRGKTIEDDLKVRDFTVNSLALSLSGDVIGDTSDIASRIIRMGYASAFTDDPVRMFRAFRFASSLGFGIDDGTLAKISELKHLLKTTASERVLEEFRKMALGDSFASAAELMTSCGIAQIVFGCEFDAKAATRAKEKCGASVAAIIACACANPCAAAEKLGLSGKEIKLVKALIDGEKELNKLDNANTRAIKIFAWKHRALIADFIPFYVAKYPERSYMAGTIAESTASLDIRKGELVNGEMLKTAGYEPSPLFKAIIDETAILLALGELEENNIIEHILLKYPKGEL